MPSLDAGETQVDTVTVGGRDADGVNSRVPLIAGQVYELRASGTYEYGAGPADAECSATTTDDAWVRDRYTSGGRDLGGLELQQADAEWLAVDADLAGCDPDHRYTLRFEPLTTGTINLRVADEFYGDNGGALTVDIVMIDEPATSGELVDEFDVDAKDADGAVSNIASQLGTRYRLVATGVFEYGVDDATADAACVQVAGGPGVPKETANRAAGVAAEVWVNGREAAWAPEPSQPTGCDDTAHRYAYDVPAMPAGQRISVAVQDSWYGDNAGSLHIEVYANPTPEAPVTPPLNTLETVQVDSTKPGGASTVEPLVAGQRYLFEVAGTYQYGLASADAACTTGLNDPSYMRDRYTDTFGRNLGLLQVNGSDATSLWDPVVPDANNCNTADHQYRMSFVPSATAPVNFKVNDTYYGDNTGFLTVRVSIDGNPPQGDQVDEFAIDSRDADGTTSTVQMQPDEAYRVQVSGNFGFGVAGATADAACVQVAGAPGQRTEIPNQVARASATVGIGGSEVAWVSTRVAPGACNDEDHTYIYDVPAGSSGPIQVGVLDSYHGDNAGLLQVRIFQNPPPTASLTSPNLSNIENVRVDTRSATGTASKAVLLAGEQYVLEASGIFDYGIGSGDAECTAAPPDHSLAPDRFTGPDGSDLASLQVAGADVEWVPVEDTGDGCNARDNRYRLAFSPATTGPVVFRVNDTYFGDNGGFLGVGIYQLSIPAGPGSPTGTDRPDERFDVAANRASGGTSATSLSPTDRYRLVLDGVFTYNAAAGTADAACVKPAGRGGVRHETIAPVGRLGVVVNDQPVTWVSTRPSPTGCNEVDSTYYVDLPDGTSGPVTVRVVDGFHGDNAGALHVRLYRNPAPLGSPLPPVFG